MTTSSPRPVVFLERDRVLVESVPDETSGSLRPPSHADELVLTRWAAMVLRQLRDLGYLCIAVATHDAALGGRPGVSPLRTARLHLRLQEDLRRFGARLDGAYDATTFGGGPLHAAPPDGNADMAEHARQAAVQAAMVEAIDVHNVDPNRSAVVGVSPPLLAAGRAIGAYTILLRPERNRGGAATAPGTADVAAAAEGADFVVPTLPDVVAVVQRLRESQLRGPR